MQNHSVVINVCSAEEPGGLVLFGSVVADPPNTRVPQAGLMPATHFSGQLYALCETTGGT